MRKRAKRAPEGALTFRMSGHYCIIMSELLVREEELVREIERRANHHGVSAEEELRRILNEALDPQAPPEVRKPYTLYDHILKLGEIAPDFEFVRERTRSDRPVDLG